MRRQMSREKRLWERYGEDCKACGNPVVTSDDNSQDALCSYTHYFFHYNTELSFEKHVKHYLSFQLTSNIFFVNIRQESLPYSKPNIFLNLFL